jgi:S-adenosylmethionine decarboxylase proenzyme
LKTAAQHLLVEYHGCDVAVLNDKGRIEELMRHGAEAARSTVVGSVFHTFSPYGVSGVVVVEESHFSIHTWPEYGYAAVDCYTCGDCEPENAHKILREGLGAATSEVMVLERGQHPSRPSMRVSSHRLEETGLHSPPHELLSITCVDGKS